MRIVVAEDSVLLREGLTRLLTDAGEQVVAQAGDAATLLAAVAEHEPDLAMIDVRMPPSFTDEGARAAREIALRHPRVAILVVSQDPEPALAAQLGTRGGFGYLLKDRVLDLEQFLDSVRLVASGGSVLDADVAAELTTGRPADDPLASLTSREREVLGLVAEGLTNTGIARRLWLTDRTVETHIRHVMMKLDLPDTLDDHRRVRAVITYLQATWAAAGRP